MISTDYGAGVSFTSVPSLPGTWLATGPRSAVGSDYDCRTRVCKFFSDAHVHVPILHSPGYNTGLFSE